MIEKTRHLPDELISPWYVRLFTNRRREVRLRLHDVVKLRGIVNLHTDLLEPPDTYWDVPELERAYESIVKELDIYGRVDLVNRRLDYTNQLVELLRTQLVDENSHQLERIIIVLIAVEIVQTGLLHS